MDKGLLAPGVADRAPYRPLDGVGGGIGIPALRQAIARHQQRHYGLELDPDTQVVVTTGCTEGIAAALLGLVFSVLAAAASVYLLVGSMLGAFTVPGWTSIVLSLWFLAGLIMLVLGVHGFYLSRVFAEVRRRPRLLVETTTDAAAAVAPTR